MLCIEISYFLLFVYLEGLPLHSLSEAFGGESDKEMRKGFSENSSKAH
jgi:hypothetical protein